MLDEDEGFGDITSNSVIGENEEVRAYIVSKDEGILAGINIAKELFESKRVKVLFHLSDGLNDPETVSGSPSPRHQFHIFSSLRQTKKSCPNTGTRHTSCGTTQVDA